MTIELERQFKLKKDIDDPRDFRFSSPRLEATNLPAKVDLRAQMSPVVDQGKLGSCTSNASVSGLREHLMLKNGEQYVPLSRLYHYWHERDLEGTVSEDSGAYLRDAMKVLATIGVCPESLYPYDVNKFTDTPSADAEKAAPAYKISSYHRILTLDELKAALADGKPVVIGLALYQSIYNWNVSFDGLIAMPDKAKEKILGGHAMLAVGYDDNMTNTDKGYKGHVIVRNSWGVDWGDHGYCYLPYDYISDSSLTFDMWVGEYVPANPWDGIAVEDAVNHISSLTFKNGNTVSDSPDFWKNLIAKYPETSDSDFRYFGLLLRKIEAYLQGK